MTIEIEEIIKEIAVRHGIAVSRDDPIMVLRTINEILLKDSKTAQIEMMALFKSDLEEVASRWELAANGKAEKIINASLDASRKAMASQMDEGVKSAVEGIRSSLQADKKSSLELINSAVGETRKFAILNIIAAALTITAALIAAFAMT